MFPLVTWWDVGKRSEQLWISAGAFLFSIWMVCWQQNQVEGGLVKFPVYCEGRCSEIQKVFVHGLAASHNGRCGYRLFRVVNCSENGQSPVPFRWLNAKWFCFLDRFQHSLWTAMLECRLGFIVICWLLEIWLQPVNYQIQPQPEVKIHVS